MHRLGCVLSKLEQLNRTEEGTLWIKNPATGNQKSLFSAICITFCTFLKSFERINFYDLEVI